MNLRRRFSASESSRTFEGVAKFRYEYAAEFVANKAVLDLGCGYSEGSSYLALNGAKFVDAVDYSKKVIEVASKKYLLQNLQYHWMNVLELHKLQKKYDVVTAFELIEHIPITEQTHLLKIIYPLLNPGGILLLTTPNRFFSSTGRKTPHNPFHTREFSYKELQEIIPDEYSSFKIYGIVCKNKQFNDAVKTITSRESYRYIRFIERIPWIYDILPYIPKKIKNFFTGLDKLPELRTSDFEVVTRNVSDCESFLVAARL